VRRFGRVDSNQNEIVKALEQIGCTVQSLTIVGGGCPDLLVGYHGDNLLLELKGPDGRVRQSQRDWQERWRGNVAMVASVDAALRWVMASGK
jgi:hypothetical protein